MSDLCGFNFIDCHGSGGCEPMKTADGFDSCLIGKDSNHRAVYDADAMIEVLMMRDDMDREDAEDYFWFNISGAYVGDDTPIYVFLNYDR